MASIVQIVLADNIQTSELCWIMTVTRENLFYLKGNNTFFWEVLKARVLFSIYKDSKIVGCGKKLQMPHVIKIYLYNKLCFTHV